MIESLPNINKCVYSRKIATRDSLVRYLKSLQNPICIIYNL